MKSKNLVRFHFTPIDWQNLISLLTPSVGKDERKQELLYNSRLEYIALIFLVNNLEILVPGTFEVVHILQLGHSTLGVNLENYHM